VSKRILLLISFVSLFVLPGNAQVNVVGNLSELLPAECVTQEQVFPILNQIFGGCVDDPTATGEMIAEAFIENDLLPANFTYDADACVTKGFLSQILYRALNLRPNFGEWLRIVTTGLDPDTALNIAQRYCVMVLGTADDLLTGREFVACVIATIQMELKSERLSCGRFRYHFGELRNLLLQLLSAVMSEAEVATYIPCFVVVPTS